MSLKEHRLESTYYFHGMVNVRCDRVRVPDGREAERVVVEHPGAAAVLAVNNHGKTVLVRQFRYPVGEELLEIPAGKLDPGEEPESCARRELAEETGTEVDELVSLGWHYTTPGFSNEKIHFFWARVGEKTTQTSHDPDEFMETEWLDALTILSMIMDGRITDSKTICAIFLAQTRGLWPPD